MQTLGIESIKDSGIDLHILELSLCERGVCIRQTVLRLTVPFCQGVQLIMLGALAVNVSSRASQVGIGRQKSSSGLNFSWGFNGGQSHWHVEGFQV